MKYVLIIIAVGILLYVSMLGLRGLCEPDEGRYAEIAREMIEKKDFLQPRLNYIKHFHKPPLVYWLVAGSFLSFGINEFTARLPVALCAIFGLVITWFLAISMDRDKKSAFLSSMVLATSLQYFIWSNILAADMIFSVFIYLAFLGFCRWYKGKPNSIYLFFIGLALAFMVKGPVAVIISFLVVLIYLSLTKEWYLLKQKRILIGAGIFLFIVAPWFVYVCIKNPGLFRYFIFDQSLDRLVSTVHGREGNFLYFIPVLAIGFLPWIYFLPAAAARYKPWKGKDKTWLFLSLWVVVPIIFFSFSRSKLPGYILPIYPSLAIFVGSYIYDKGYLKSFGIICIIAGIIYMAGAGFLPRLEEKLGQNLSIRKIAQYINERNLTGDRVVNFRCFLQGLPFYLKERVIFVEKERETQFEEDPFIHKDYIFPSAGEFWGTVDKDDTVWCFTFEEDYNDLIKGSPVKLHKVWQAGEYILVSNYEK